MVVMMLTRHETLFAVIIVVGVVVWIALIRWAVSL
jgi:hypothetical protein